MVRILADMQRQCVLLSIAHAAGALVNEVIRAEMQTTMATQRVQVLVRLSAVRTVEAVILSSIV